ncbi:SDR family NAD(P)-dependent oxidoreductase [Catellatospora bangladeshensis]|uniref:Short-chain dehydrogenase n=1 Tax=Catellatospora bangladeshensis TaxID=310355 RepID=A0A8J3NJJ4_9ACTN|nr:SDR family NAD(P)-dependent oxidoreductase [Catellatospora bangladeshensis]GIF83530.1 short-chain dehydrogenase [Catellatospora bangladeshensis]
MLILVTGSTDGIGLRTATALADAGHRVVAHARDEPKAAELKARAPELHAVLVGDLASLRQTRALARAATAFGVFDAVVHNAGVSRMDAPQPLLTEDGLETTFQVNVLAPYTLTALMPPPRRLVYVSSAMAADGVIDLATAGSPQPWHGVTAYCTSKLYVLMLAFAVARHWPGVRSNATDPGWVATRMGGPQAPIGPDQGARPQVRLAGGDADELGSGRFVTDRGWQPSGAACDPAVQDELLSACARLSGVTLPPAARLAR